MNKQKPNIRKYTIKQVLEELKIIKKDLKQAKQEIKLQEFLALYIFIIALCVAFTGLFLSHENVGFGNTALILLGISIIILVIIAYLNVKFWLERRK